jgi:hypothetical protein
MDWAITAGLVCETITLLLSFVLILLMYRQLKLLADSQDILNQKWQSLLTDLAKTINQNARDRD